ncbi:MAG: polyprenol monophosphomannose synthase [Bdellovibrionales bacterium]|nr:polyprenol monophosphomannose synthase [Bdellovibrionales bacterium]
MRALIVVPTYNEAENIKSLVEAILASTPSSIDILIVDDGSPDGTGALADVLAVRHEPRVHVLHRAKKMGLGTAYVNGFRWGLGRSEYSAFIEMDADFSHNPSYLKTMLSTLETSDVAIGSRYVPGGGTVNWGIGRKILSRGGSFYSRVILGAPIRDFTGGFNGWRRAVLDAVDLESLRSDGYSFQIELKYRAFLRGFRIKEFPIIFEDRKVGKSKMNRRIVFEALARVWGFRLNSRKFLTSPERAH